MSDEDYTCICSHGLEQHNDPLGYCEALGCRCVVYRTAEELEDEDEDDDLEEELNFDTDDEEAV